MPISIERYVDITSAVIGAAQAQARSLVGLRFSQSPRVPADGYITAGGANDVGEYFGFDSLEYSFAADYFSYVSKAPARRPSMLRFAPYVSADRSARVYGTQTTASVADFAALTGSELTISLKGAPEDVTPDLTGVGSFSDVSAAIQTALRVSGNPDFTTALVTFDAIEGAFNFDSGEAGEAAVSVEAGDLAAALGWSTGAVMSPGAAARTPVESLAWADNFNDSFGSFSFGADLPVPDQVAVAQLNAGYNVKYMFLAWTNPGALDALAAALIGIASAAVHVNGMSAAEKNSEALPAAILAAINFGDRNSLPNFMFQQNATWGSDLYSDVNDNAEANRLDALRVNYYGNTATAGQNIQFYQRGYMTGGAATLQDMTVHAGEQWLKSAAKADLMNLLLATNSIPANNDGRGMVMAVLAGGVIQQALFNGTIIIDKDLTQVQRALVTEMTGDGNAWHQVQAAGYILDARVEAYTGPSQLTEYQVNYVLIYAKRDVIRKVVGSHNLV